MKVPVIIQARMSSRRFPGKVLTPLDGRPLLAHLLERLSKARRAGGIVVATSQERSDEAIRVYCRTNQIACYAGPLENVAQRFAEVIEHYAFQSFARVSGDSPLFNEGLLDEAIRLFQSNRYDIVTNIYERSYPKGQSVEVLRAEVFLKNVPKMKDASEEEHPTLYFYKNAAAFKIYNMKNPEGDRSKENWCVDTPGDLERIESLLTKAKAVAS